MTVGLRRLMTACAALLVLAGCGGGGGGGPQPPPPDPGSSNWDELIWDEDDWV